MIYGILAIAIAIFLATIFWPRKAAETRKKPSGAEPKLKVGLVAESNHRVDEEFDEEVVKILAKSEVDRKLGQLQNALATRIGVVSPPSPPTRENFLPVHNVPLQPLNKV